MQVAALPTFSNRTCAEEMRLLRWMKPLDTDLIKKLGESHSVMVTVEEGSIGGFGDHVLHFLALSGLLDDGELKARPMVLPDKYIEAGSQSEQYEEAGLSKRFIGNTVLKLLGKPTMGAEIVEVSESTIA